MQELNNNKYCDINHNSLTSLMLSLLMKLDNNHLKVEDFFSLLFVLLNSFHKERLLKGAV
jgi:hypothetical protein